MSVSPILRSAKRYLNTGSGNYTSVTLTANGSANTKGSYSEIIASLTHDISGLLVSLTPQGLANEDYLIDIAIGAGGSEQIIIENFLISASNIGLAGVTMVLFPVSIPAGKRLSARIQSSTGSATISAVFKGVTGGALDTQGMQRYVTLGANTADSGGTSVDPGAVLSTKGSYVEFSSSIPFNFKHFFVLFGGQINAAMADADWAFDIAIGGAGSEQIIIPDLYVHADSARDEITPSCIQMDIDIPAGSRLAVRALANTTDATDRLVDVVLIGVG